MIHVSYALIYRSFQVLCINKYLYRYVWSVRVYFGEYVTLNNIKTLFQKPGRM